MFSKAIVSALIILVIVVFAFGLLFLLDFNLIKIVVFNLGLILLIRFLMCLTSIYEKTNKGVKEGASEKMEKDTSISIDIKYEIIKDFLITIKDDDFIKSYLGIALNCSMFIFEESDIDEVVSDYLDSLLTIKEKGFLSSIVTPREIWRTKYFLRVMTETNQMISFYLEPLKVLGLSFNGMELDKVYKARDLNIVIFGEKNDN